MVLELVVWAVSLADGRPAAAESQSPDGFWRSIGYGLLWQVAGDELASWEVTETTCVPSSRYRRDRADSTNLVYRADSALGAVANDWLIRPGRTQNHFAAHVPGTLTDVLFARVKALPARCRKPTGSTPREVFETFSRTMTEHYAFFRERKVDWLRTVGSARRELDSATDDRARYQVLEQMMAPLWDAHTDITAPELGLRVRHYRRTPSSLEPATVLELRRLAPTGLIGPLESFNDGRIQLGDLSDSTGYLRINLLYGYGAGGRFEDDSVAIERTLAEVMPKVAAKKRMVLDLRLNGGGYDALARLVASHFTAQPYLALLKQARLPTATPSRARFTPPAGIRIMPAAQDRFVGPLVILTGIHTVSAGEVLVLMLMNRRPAPIRIGQPTQGVFADELVRRLPNGWKFQLSSERYLTPTGKTFEGPGIPPDISVPVYPPHERDGKVDRPLARGLEALKPR
jgi:hypothetical protein